MQVALALVSFALMVVSVNAYRARREGRYLLLMVAFVLLFAASVSTVSLELVAGAGPTAAQFVEVYLNPSLELLMVVSFLAAILWSGKGRSRIVTAFVATVVAVGLVVTAFYTLATPVGGGFGAPSLLPAGCVRPAGGFLIIASSLGYNDSIAHGAPVKAWPILQVMQGTNVEITICNTYSQTVGFQVSHYLANRLEAIPPGKDVTVNFLANQTGTFVVYCSVFNPIHIYLQGGELNVL